MAAYLVAWGIRNLPLEIKSSALDPLGSCHRVSWKWSNPAFNLSEVLEGMGDAGGSLQFLQGLA